MSGLACGAKGPSLLSRMWGRLRHGLLMQEMVDRISAWGLAVQPYILTVELASSLPKIPQPLGYEIRELTVSDAEQIVAISIRRRELAEICELFSAQRCHGVFKDTRLAGYTWTSFTDVPVLGGSSALFSLADDEAYLRDMYIAPAHRGARLAPWLRAHVLRALASDGRRTCFSVTLFCNRSSRRFKARLGAREAEWRLHLHWRVGDLPGMDLCIRRLGATLRSPRFRRVAAVRKQGHER